MGVVADAHAGAGLRESGGDAAADVDGAAGDQRDAVFGIHACSRV